MAKRALRKFTVVRLRTNMLMGAWVTQTQIEGHRKIFLGEGKTPEAARNACIGQVIAWLSDNQPNTLIHWEDLVF